MTTSPETAAGVEPAAEDEYETLFTIQVWQLGLLVIGVLVVAGHFLFGLPLPLASSSYLKFKLGIKLLELLVVLVVVGGLLFAVRRSPAADEG